MRFHRMVLLSALLVALVPVPASAQFLVTPFVGGNFGGDTIEPPKVTYGASVAFMGAGVIGVEADFAFSPKFFPEHHPDATLHAVGDIASVMANLIVGLPFEVDGIGVRPYGSAGVGVIAVRADEPRDLLDVRGTDLGFNFGAGIFGFFSEGLGIRGDLRYFRNLREDVSASDLGHGGSVTFGGFDYWRGTIGLTFRF